MRDHHDVAAIAAELRARLDALPKIDHQQGDLIGQSKRFHEAVRLLGLDLCRAHAATITDRWNGARVRMAGITSTSTSGVSGALRNWLTAAEKRITERVA